MSKRMDKQHATDKGKGQSKLSRSSDTTFIYEILLYKRQLLTTDKMKKKTCDSLDTPIYGQNKRVREHDLF